MSCRCPIGSRPDVTQIDEALRLIGEPGAESLSAISRRTGVAKSSLSVHRSKCLTATRKGPSEAPATPSEEAPPPSEDRPVQSRFERPLNGRGTGLNIGERALGQRPLSSIPKSPGDDAFTAPRRLITAELERRAVRLRAKGCAYDQIADELGVDEDQAIDLVERALARTHELSNRDARKLRALEVARLDELTQALWDRATDPGCVSVNVPAENEQGYKAYDGQDKAIDRLTKLSERRAKLLGLDAPTSPTTQINLFQSPVFTEFVGEILDELMKYPEALEAVKARLRARMQPHPRPVLTVVGA